MFGCLRLIASLLLDEHPTVKQKFMECWKQKKSEKLILLLLSCFRTMNNIANINLKMFQTVIEVSRIEVCHILSHLLSYLIHFQSTTFEKKPTDAAFSKNHVLLLDEAIIFVGLCSWTNSTFQECFRWGKQFNLLKKLCSLSFEYFINPKLSSGIILHVVVMNFT